jgi:hypothetical protein
MESLLLQGSQRSWAAQLSVDHGAPLLDPDPDAVADTFNIDPTLVLYRDGQWTIDPNAPAKPPKTTPKSDPKNKPPAPSNEAGKDSSSTAGN